MLRVDYRVTYGEVKVKNHEGKIGCIKIHLCNALCAFIYHYKDENGKKMAQFISFFGDEQHIRNIMKEYGQLFGSNVVSVKLNVFYKEARTLVAPMAQSGYKVSVYYKEPKKSKNDK